MKKKTIIPLLILSMILGVLSGSIPALADNCGDTGWHCWSAYFQNDTVPSFMSSPGFNECSPTIPTYYFCVITDEGRSYATISFTGFGAVGPSGGYRHYVSVSADTNTDLYSRYLYIYCDLNGGPWQSMLSTTVQWTFNYNAVTVPSSCIGGQYDVTNVHIDLTTYTGSWKDAVVYWEVNNNPLSPSP